MRLSLSTGFVLAAIAVSGLSASLHAAPITLDNSGGNQSTVQAFASDDDNGTTVTNDVNTLPFTTPTTVTDGQSTSTVTSTLTTSALNFGFNQTLLDTEAPTETSGEGDIFFKAGTNVTYSISGSMTVTGDFVQGELATSLYDVTTSTYAYNYDQFTGFVGIGAQPALIPVGSATLTLDTRGGSLSGSLNAGDTYEFDAYQDMNDFVDPNLTGNVGISFSQLQAPGGGSVPLPSAAMSGLATLIGLGIVLAAGRGKSAVA